MRRSVSHLAILGAALGLLDGNMNVTAPEALVREVPSGYSFRDRLPNQRQRRIRARRGGAR